MIRSGRKSDSIQDDATMVAGWVFADLLLSLSIIFLTSISFAVPSGNAGASVGNGSLTQATTNQKLEVGFIKSPLVDGFNFYFKEFNKELLKRDLERYFETKGLPANTEILYAQIAGGYKEGVDGSEVGTMTALKFSISLNKAGLKAFQHTSVDLLTSSQIPSGTVALRLTFTQALVNQD